MQAGGWAAEVCGAQRAEVQPGELQQLVSSQLVPLLCPPRTCCSAQQAKAPAHPIQAPRQEALHSRLRQRFGRERRRVDWDANG